MPELEDIDKEGMLEVIENFWKQCLNGMKLGTTLRVDSPVDGIIFCGMGGSAIPGEIIKGIIHVEIPVEVIRSYKIPDWATKNTLVVCVSYSGNTEEPISCLKSAKSKGAKILCVASGGRLKEICEKTNTPIIVVPRGIQPRSATGYMTMPILNFLSNSRIIDDMTEDMIAAAKVLKKDIKEKGEELSQRLIDKVPLIYSSDRMIAVARLWKAAVNEHAKTSAFFNAIPEMNHNEINGFVNLKAPFYAIFIEDEDDHPRIKKRMAVTKDILQEREVPALIVKLSGPNALARMLFGILLGSYVGYYLALTYGIDPTPVEMVEGFKKKLGNYSG